MVTDTFVPAGILSDKQNKYLFTNVIDAVKINVTNNYQHIITVSADTGDGKTFTLINYILPELIRMGVTNHIYMAPDAGLVKQTRDMAHDIMSMQLIAGKPVNIIDEDLGKKYIKGTLTMPKNCVNVFFITKKMFLENKDVFITGHLSKAKVGTWSVFDDEAHSQTGTSTVRDTKANTGVSNKQAKLSTFKALNTFRKAGNNIIGTSATLTNSQRGNTTDGRKVFLRLDPMPKDPMTCTFADFTTVSAIDYFNDTQGYWNFEKMLQAGLQLFLQHAKSVDQMHSGINDATWNVLNTMPNSKFACVRPDLIIKVGRANATNGIKYEDCISSIEQFVKKNDLVLADFVEMTYDGKKIKDMGEMIKAINTLGLERNVVMVTKDKASVGINVPTATHAIIARTPAQKVIHNNWSQFLGRITRMPFFRSHQEAKDFIFGLDIHYDQKALLSNYYAAMTWSHCIVPEESELLASRVNFDDTDEDDIDETVMDYRLKNTMNLEAGKQFLFDGLQESCTGKNGIGYTLTTKLTQAQSNFIKGKFCGNCKRDENGLPVCLPNVYETYCKTYGHVSLEDFLSQTDKSASVREHKDNDHFNNKPENIAYVCATLSAFKTDINKDWNQSYTKVNGKMVPSKLNEFVV